ncbi:MAG: glycoside hydrolase family 76 protein, partial [Bacteroidales bacterium]|nr:glycoside hydrolase family 76 protein [Bacteroidales bacterium]
MILYRYFLLFFPLFFSACSGTSTDHPEYLPMAEETLDHIYTYYGVENTPLLRENYPFDASYSATYLASEDTGSVKQFAYLWPFSGTFSAVNALLHASNDKKYLEILENRVLPALEKYYDDSRQPPGYASYLRESGWSDRFYDDNVWLGIDFVDLYMYTKNTEYLEKSKEIWQFILSGTDEELEGGIYWCEQKKRSKNTCSNAPGSVMAFKLFKATRDSTFFHQGLSLYNWTKKQLQDTGDHLYYDNISLTGRVDKRKYAYNSGQMLQSAVLLYSLTNDQEYLSEARQIAESAILYFTDNFTTDDGRSFRMIKKGNVWFTAVMFRGFVELYTIDKERKYIDIFARNLEYAWLKNRDVNHLFSDDWSGKSGKKNRWL